MWGTYDLSEFSDEVKNLCWINERFENEDEWVKYMRYSFAQVAVNLIWRKQTAGHSEAGRHYSLAVTHLEDACIRAIKGLYS